MGKRSDEFYIFNFAVSISYTLQVPLGILLKSKTKYEDMISIMASLQQYVPCQKYTTDEILSTGEEVKV